MDIKSAWLSKINWTVAATVLFNLLMFFGIDVPADVEAAILSVGNSVGLILVWVLRTWFTKTVTPSVAKKLP